MERDSRRIHRFFVRLGLLWAGLALGLMLIGDGQALAHRLLVLVVEGQGIIQVVYEGGIPARRALVTVHYLDGGLSEGYVDGDGYFPVTDLRSVARIEADDGLGHRVSQDFSRETEHRVPVWLRVVAGLVILLGMALLFRGYQSGAGTSRT
jgi:hypothetical protein